MRTLRGLLAPATLALVALAGCEARHRPGFVTRVEQDCIAGSEEACDLLQGMRALAADPASASPMRHDQAIRSQAQRNTDAILQGVERARAAPRPAPSHAPSDGQV